MVRKRYRELYLMFVSLKTGLFKWSPDYETAANRYEKAGVCVYTVLYCIVCIVCVKVYAIVMGGIMIKL